MESNEPKSQGDKSEFKFSRWLFYRNRLRFAIFRRDSFKCRYCGRSAKDGAQLTLEHIIPICRGGTYEPSNLLTSCHICNEGKADDLLSDIEREILKNPSVLFADWPVVGWRAAL